MPKVSKDSAEHVEETPVATDCWALLDDYRAEFVSIKEDSDLTPLLQGLPGDQCPCPHWGYLFSGRMWWQYGDRREYIEAGEAFYAPAGHTAGAEAGAEFLIFGPNEILEEVHAHMGQRAQELMSA